MSWDEQTWARLSERQLEWARSSGAFMHLASALSERIVVAVRMGDSMRAATLVAELQSAGVGGRHGLTPLGALELAAWRGVESEADALVDFALVEAEGTGETRRLPAIHAARAVLCNGLGRYEEALQAAMQASGPSGELGLSTQALSELVEAASRCGRDDVAAAALGRLSESTMASGSDWALGTEARARALTSSGGEAEGMYQRALDRLGRTQLRAEVARAHLLYGEWLRREHRRVDARQQLRMAEDLFAGMGFAGFARRAERELVATGETVRKRSDETRGQLTPQEREIARMACEGLSNPEIGSRLFLSPRTVEWHLHKIFVKLGVGSRKELRAAMADTERRTAVARQVSWADLTVVDTPFARAATVRHSARPARQVA
jgi:DNA-binding CsgD family transcriptional regulator